MGLMETRVKVLNSPTESNKSCSSIGEYLRERKRKRKRKRNRRL
jgi:hypothetical protein